MSKRQLGLLIVGLAVMYVPASMAATNSSITQFGVTFHFSTPRATGQFANGDYWVLGPVIITRIEPDFKSGTNGWEVNPKVQTPQGFQSDGPAYNAALMPALPYTASSNQSIVKVVGGKVRHSVVKKAVVLTVLMDVPPGNGTGLFRPPYMGNDKPLYRVADVKTNLLPSLLPVGSTPSLQSVITNFTRGLRMDHHITHARQLRPTDVMDDYQPANTMTINNAMLRLMLDDPLADKMPLLIQVTQHAIDRAYAVIGGYRLSGTGHNPNHRILAGWAAAMLDIPAAANLLSTTITMHEDYYVSKIGNVALWGQTDSSEFQYWNHIMTTAGSRSHRDPYGHIDGGILTSVGAGYQNIVSQAWKGQVLATYLMPALSVSWHPDRWPILAEYVDRWVSVGTWARPDPIAPYDGTNLNYGITYGPESMNQGLPILGIGRFPQFHGANRDGGQYKSAFVTAMWDAYRDRLPPAPPLPPSGLRVRPE